MSKAFARAAAALSLVLFGAAGVHAETFKLSIGAGHPADASVWIGAIRDFMTPEISKRVEQRTGHRIEWTTAYGGSVCRLGECLEAAESGLLDVVAIAVPFEPTKLMAHNFSYFVPFGSPDPEIVARAALKVYDTVPGLKQILESKYNQVYLGVGVVGNYNLVTRFPWDKVEQLKNRKIAAAGPNLPWLKSVAAIPVQSNLNEAYTSFQTGVYEGWIMYPDATVGFKLHEVAKHYTITDFGAIHATLITINKSTWSRLPKQVQEIFLEVGREYTAVEARMVVEKTKASLEAMKTGGASVRSLGEEQKVIWANALSDIPSERTAEIRKSGQAAEAVAAYIRALKEAGVKLPRDWQVR